MSYSNRARREKNIYMLVNTYYMPAISIYIISFNHYYKYFFHFKDMQNENDSNHNSGISPFFDKRDLVKPWTLGLKISDWSPA